MTTATPPVVIPAAADLILARLAVVAKEPPSAVTIRKDVARVLGRTMSADEFKVLTDNLIREELAERRPKSRNGVQLTPMGRERALAFLGVTELPARTNWPAVRTKYLFAKALKVSATEAEKFDSADRLTAFLLRREYGLPAGTTVAEALQDIVCQRLGHPNETTLDGLYRIVLSEVLGSDERLAKADIVKQFPRKLTGSNSGKLDDLRQAVIGKWLRESSIGDGNRSPRVNEPSTLLNEATFDLSAFAATVKRLARDCPPAARFGRNKVFIAAAWRDSQQEDGFPRMQLDEFKTHLVEANRAGLLRLEPADLVQAMDSALVAESRTEQAGAALHFILIEEVFP